MFDVNSLELWDEDIDNVKKEAEYWKEREPEKIETFSFTETVIVPENCPCNAGRKFATAVFKGDQQLYRRILAICGIKF